MKAHLITLLIAFFAGYIGGHLGGGNLGGNDSIDELSENSNFENKLSPFQVSTEDIDLEYQIEALNYKIESLQKQVSSLEDKQTSLLTGSQNNSKETVKIKPNRNASPNRENLVASGMTPDLADEILRRMSQEDFRRLELQNLIQRSDASARREYRKELRELNANKISLRSELGDDDYDKYLFVSGQNNRVKVRSVMAGSPAESSGFQNDDVILYYDNKKILSWPDIRAATIEGDIGSYTSVEILRDGQQMSLMVPRGTLGVQLDATQIEPD